MDSTRSPIPTIPPPALAVAVPGDDVVGGGRRSIHFRSGAFLTSDAAAPAAAALTCGASSSSSIVKRPAGSTGLLPPDCTLDAAESPSLPPLFAPPGTHGARNSTQCGYKLLASFAAIDSSSVRA